MDRFLRPISVIALFQELVVFGGLIFTLTFLKAHERVMGIDPTFYAPHSRFLTNWWGLIALVPLAWVIFAMLDEDSEEGRFGERFHFWAGVGLLLMLTWFAGAASHEAMTGPCGPIQTGPW